MLIYRYPEEIGLIPALQTKGVRKDFLKKWPGSQRLKDEQDLTRQRIIGEKEVRVGKVVQTKRTIGIMILKYEGIQCISRIENRWLKLLDRENTGGDYVPKMDTKQNLNGIEDHVEDFSLLPYRCFFFFFLLIPHIQHRQIF